MHETEEKEDYCSREVLEKEVGRDVGPHIGDWKFWVVFRV